MRPFLSFFLLAGLAVSAAAQRDIGVVDVQSDVSTIPVSVNGSTPEVQNLARLAFDAHGRYRRVASGGAFDLGFKDEGANRVTVTVTKAGAAVLRETVSGTSPRHALLRAADLAVTKTSGLRGFFAGKLAFVSDQGGQQTILTSDLFLGEVLSHPVQGKQIVGPRWSPDGHKVIFTSYRTGFPDIYTLDLRDRRLSVFISVKGTNSGARFSPDGTRVAMVLSGEGNPEIYVASAAGRIQRRLTTNQSVEASPAWSPDGAQLIFTSDAAGGPQLHLMSASGGLMQRLPTNISRYCAEPDWSQADPRKIVFTAAVGKGYQIAVHELGTKASRIVSKAPTDAIEPVWTADGRHVVCTFRTATTRALYLLDTESGKATRLSPATGFSAGNASYLAP